ncbi:MAG: solute carrier family 23 protein, partial [Myxococcota bacterium]
LEDFGFALALIASAETLLCAAAVDRIHDGPRTNYDKELAAQGVGNMVCGIFGALPATGVIVRSSANVEAGGKTRASAILHGIWLLLLVGFFPSLLELIPTSALAAILVYIGYKLLNPASWKGMWEADRSEFAIYMITIVSIVATDLLTGILIGLGLAIAKFVYTFAQLDVLYEHDIESNRVDLTISGAATFLRLPDLTDAFQKIPPQADVYMHIGQLAYIDHACHEEILAFQKNHEADGGHVYTVWDAIEMSRQRDNVFEQNDVDKPLTKRDEFISRSDTKLPAHSGA